MFEVNNDRYSTWELELPENSGEDFMNSKDILFSGEPIMQSIRLIKEYYKRHTGESLTTEQALKIIEISHINSLEGELKSINKNIEEISWYFEK